MLTINLPKEYFQVIYADPPWHFETWSDKGQSRAPSAHYNTMSLKDIYNLNVAVGDLAAPNCALFMWAVDPLLDKAFKVLDAWGFTYKTVGFYWVKLNKKARLISTLDGEQTFNLSDLYMGMGRWTRANPELCLLATRGAPKRKAAGIRKTILDNVREHSRKPDCMYEKIESLVDGPYVELFARNKRPGWSAWGNEVEKFDAVAV